MPLGGRFAHVARERSVSPGGRIVFREYCYELSGYIFYVRVGDLALVVATMSSYHVETC